MSKTAQTASAQIDSLAQFNPLIAKENFEKFTAGFGDLNAEGKRNLEALSSSAAIATKATQALGVQTTNYYKSAFESYAAQAKELATAQSFQAVIELQTAFSKSALEAFSAHIASASELVSSAVKDASRPLNERAVAVAGKFTPAR